MTLYNGPVESGLENIVPLPSLFPSEVKFLGEDEDTAKMFLSQFFPWFHKKIKLDSNQWKKIFLQENSDVLKLRYPNLGIDIFLPFSYLKRLRALSLQLKNDIFILGHSD